MCPTLEKDVAPKHLGQSENFFLETMHEGHPIYAEYVQYGNSSGSYLPYLLRGNLSQPSMQHLL